MKRRARQPRQNSKEAAAHSFCMRCGLCCDGTLYDRVYIYNSSEQDRLSAMGIDLCADQKDKYLKQPCPFHVRGVCRVYDIRPGTCAGFKCILLNQYLKDEVSSAQAFDIVDKTMRGRKIVERKITSILGRTETAALPELFRDFCVSKNMAMDAVAFRKMYSDLIVEYVSFMVRIDYYFYKWKKPV